VYYGESYTEFALADAHGNNVGDIDHLFAENVVVKVILDVTNAMAFVQNADTNAYIERTFVKTVNGTTPDETGNVNVSTAMKVTVTQNSEGVYFADHDPDRIQEALDDDQTVVCYWYDKNILLYQSSFQRGGPYIFTAIDGAKEYRVVIRDTEDVTCTVTELSGEPPTDMNVVWKSILYYTVEEEVSSFSIDITDIMEQLFNTPDVLIHFYAAKVSGSDVLGTSPKGTIALTTSISNKTLLKDAAIAPTNIYVSNASSRYSIDTYIRLKLNKRFRSMDYGIRPANANAAYVFNQDCGASPVEGYENYLKVSFTDCVIGKGSTLGIYVPGYKRGE
jgi:hypothetical protein